MSDSKRGSKTYRLAMSYDRDGVVFERPAQKLKRPEKRGSHPNSWGWFCSNPSSMVTAGFGMTKNDAFVDFVEEHWCMFGNFPKGYPN